MDRTPGRGRQPMNNLRKARGAEKQPQVARATGITVPDLSRYECGRNNPTQWQMQSLCKHYKEPADKLLTRDEWDYSLTCPMTRKDKRKAGRGTGIRKITSRVTERLASRIHEQCEADGLTLAQWLAICADIYERRERKRSLQSCAQHISCGALTSSGGCSCSQSADT